MGAITKLCKTKDWAEQYPHHKTKANQKWFRITKHDQRQRNTQKEYVKTPVKTYLHVPSRITIPNRGQVTLYFFKQFENLSRWMKYYWMLMVAICRWVSPLLAPENHQAPVVQTLDNAIHRINHYPADKYYGNQLLIWKAERGLGLILKIFKTTQDLLQSAFSLKIRQKQHWLRHSQRQENRILLTIV